MCTKIKQICNPPEILIFPPKKMWIMWITWCITGFCLKKGIYQGGQLSTKSLWITVDKVDNRKIEHKFCAICLVYHNYGGIGLFL